MALGDLLAREPQPAGHHPAKAKAVIQIFCPGGMSQVDTWDHKPELAKRNGKLRKGGEPDLKSVAVSVINDWQRGKLPFFVAPSKADDDDEQDDGAEALGAGPEREMLNEEEGDVEEDGSDKEQDPDALPPPPRKKAKAKAAKKKASKKVVKEQLADSDSDEGAEVDGDVDGWDAV